MAKKLSKFSLFGYSALAIPAAFAGIPIYVNIPDYFIVKYGISLTLMGILLVVLRLLDAVQDFIIGYVCDKWHYLRLYVVIFSACSLILGFFLISFPLLSPMVSFVLGVFLASLGFSSILINLSAIGGVWSKDTNEKLRISSYRESFRILGMIIACTLPIVLMKYYEILISYQIMAICLTIVTIVCVIIFVLWYQRNREKLHDEPTTVLPSFRSYLNLNWKMYRPLYEIFFFSTTGNAIVAILFVFYARDFIGGGDYIGIFLLGYFLFAMLSIPLLNLISSKIGKRRTWLGSTVFVMITSFLAFFLNPGDYVQYLGLCAVAGISLGADLTIPPAILGDLLEIKKDYSYASGLYSIIAFLYKLMLALSGVIIFPILSYINFQPSNQNDDFSLFILVIFYTLVVASFKLLAVLRLYFWDKKLRYQNFSKT